MEQKPIMLSAVGLSLGIGLGLGLWITNAQHSIASALPSFSTPRDLLEFELLSMTIDGKGSDTTFDKFPYYLHERTKVLLMNAAVVHLKQGSFSKFTRNLVPASRAILLSGPPGAETYHQMLAKALSHTFEAKLLLLDITDFSLKLQAKYRNWKKAMTGLSAGPSLRSFTKFLRSNSFSKEMSDIANSPPARETKANKKGNTSEQWEGEPSEKSQTLAKTSSQRQSSAWAFHDRIIIKALFQVLVKLAKDGPVILYLRDVDKLFHSESETFISFQSMIQKISGPLLILGSSLSDPNSNKGNDEIDERLASLFPFSIDIKPPEDNAMLTSWKSQIEEDMKVMQIQDNRNHISEVLLANDLECDDLASICFGDTVVLSNYIEEIVVSAISYHLMNAEEPQYREGRLVISSKSLSYGLNLFQTGKLENQDARLQMDSSSEPSKESDNAEKTGTSKSDGLKKAETSASNKPMEVVPDNDFEKRIRPDVIPAGKIGVSFQDIGALDNVKELLHEAVMLPLRRPDIFSRGGLLKACKGILLFGPPGTGKTMLAKAVATEAGASFINVSMSTITSKWFGEDEKNVRALFTLATKVAPTIIFIDEVDSMLGQRSKSGEHEAMRKIKNEFMANWDGLLSNAGDQILVLAATNRPFDLDDAIIRRFERRFMIGLPEKANREKILRTLLAKEKLAEDVDFAELAAMTEGYSGSDLKNLCTVAAYRPVRDFLNREKKEAEKGKVDEAPSTEKSSSSNPANKAVPEEPSSITNSSDESLKRPELDLRPLTMADLKQSKNQISASFASEGKGMEELKEWNELYGEGGARKKKQLSYFL